MNKTKKGPYGRGIIGSNKVNKNSLDYLLYSKVNVEVKGQGQILGSKVEVKG